MTQRKPTDQRRTEIADAAIELVARHGLAALTTRALADAVGLTSGALFKHFASRDALLLGMVERAAELLRGTFPDEALPPLERLRAFRAARLALVARRAGILRLVLSEQLARAMPPEAAAALRSAVAETHGFLARAIAEGQRAGVLRDDVPAEALALLVMGALQITALTEVSPASTPGSGALDALDRLLQPLSLENR